MLRQQLRNPEVYLYLFAAAVVLPVVLGLVWMVSPAAVFLFGALIALASLLLSQLVPGAPDRGCETVFARAGTPGG